MALKAVHDTIDDIEEPYRGLYSERNGKFELTGIEGVKTQADVDRLSTSLVKERDAHKAAKALADSYAALGKLEDIQARLDRTAELEAAAAGKLDEDQLNKLVEGRLKTRLAPTEREKAKLAEDLKTAQDRLEVFEARERERTIHDAVRTAATASKVAETAMEDILLLASRIFEVTEEGKVSVKDSVGYTPGIDPVVWLTEIQSKRPHWWPPSQGGGGRGPLGGGGGGGVNPFTAEGWNMTQQGQILRENPLRAKQLAESAGTTIGGPRPTKK